jgi:hypothetical protein
MEHVMRSIPAWALGLATLALALNAGCGGGGSAPVDAVGADADAPGEVAADVGVDEVDASAEAGDPGPEACVPDCPAYNCGDDGCGGTCGPCEVGWVCYLGGCAIIDVPNCTDRECGDDGLGGSCGTCTGGTACAALTGRCVNAGPYLPPTSWGPAGVTSSLQTPSDQAVIQSTCFDYTGDGLGDNGLRGLASQVNGPLATLVQADATLLLFELLGVTDFTNTASFQLNGLMGRSASTPPAASGDVYVLLDSYILDIDAPMIYFPGARITNGALAAGPSEFQLSIPVSDGLVIDATLIQAKVKGDILAGATADGFELANGVLSGVLTKQQLETAIAKLQATCDAAPSSAKPDYCGYLKVAVNAMPLLFDLHQVGDGTFVAKSKDNPADAASICLFFGLSKAKVIGYEPNETP